MRRIVLAHSGGSGTLVAIPWLAEKYGAEIVTVTLDLGQRRHLDDVHERALSAGAARAHVIDARDEFARDFILPALRANALRGGCAPLIRALGRSAIVRHLVQIADLERASAVAHGDQEAHAEPSYEAIVRSLAPELAVIAPLRTWGLTSADVLEYARRRGLQLSAASGHSREAEANLWGRSIDSLDDGDAIPKGQSDVYLLTRSADDAVEGPAYVEIAFDRGTPVSINGVEMPIVELIQSLETIAGAHGFGRVDATEGRGAGGRSRVLYEAPAAMALHLAHAELQRAVAPQDLGAKMADLAASFVELADAGGWFTPARAAIDAQVAEVQQLVSGTVRLELHKADCRVVAGGAARASSEGASGR